MDSKRVCAGCNERVSLSAPKTLCIKCAGVRFPAQIVGIDYNLPLVSDDGVFVRLVEIDGWQRVMLELGEDTSHQALRNAIPLALQWRERLFEAQGPWMDGGDTPFLEQLSRWNAAGASYGRLAEKINERAAALVREAVEYQAAYEAVQSTITSMVDLVAWWKTARVEPFALDHARDLLRAVKVDEHDIQESLQEGMRRIKDGRPPFAKGAPVDRDKMIAVLRTWRSSRDHTWIESET